VKLVGIGLIALGAIRLYVGLKGSFTAPVAGGFQGTVQLEQPSAVSKAATIGTIVAGFFLVLR
jgi:hypothetical protein